MTKSRFVELVLLNIGGGVLTDEMDVKRVDIEAYLPIAINLALTIARNNSISQEGNRDLPSMFFGTFTNLPIDRTGNVPFITLPNGYVPLYGNEGLRSVFDNCGNYYAPLMEADRRVMQTQCSGGNKLIDQGFYFPVGKKKVEVYPTGPLVESLNGEYLVDADDLTDDDELPLVGDTGDIALMKTLEWFTGQRTNPADMITDKSDQANVIQKP